MILRSFLLVYSFFINSGIVANLSYAQEPMSAIDWLAEKINDPPVFYTNPSVNIKNQDEKIEIINLPSISKNSIGIYPSIKIGINFDIWKNSNEIEISNLLEKINTSDIYFLNRLFKRILLVEADPPIISNNLEFSGIYFLRARILKLIEMGALDDAEVLLLDANPSSDPKLIDLWSKISFLTYRFDKFCNSVLNGYHKLLDPSHKIICLARSGDWNAAALSLATYSSIKEINSDNEKLLINYLDHEAEIEIINKAKCNIDKPIIVYLCSFSTVNNQNSNFQVKYLYNNLGRGKSIRSKIIASEELVKSGALNSSFLFSTYKIKQPSTSGGVWARAKQVQQLEDIIQFKSYNPEFLSNHLKVMIDEFLKNKLLTAFAEYYGKQLKFSNSNYRPLNDQILMINILSGEYNSINDLDTITNPKLKNLIKTINIRDSAILNPKKDINHLDFLNNEVNTELQRAIFKASYGIIPDGIFSNKSLEESFSRKEHGKVLLNAISLISNASSSNIPSIQIGLASLVKLGLINDFKAISNELLIMEYLKQL